MNELQPQEVIDGYAVIWAISYHKGLFYYSVGYGTRPEKLGSSTVHIYHENGLLFFSVQDCYETFSYLENNERVMSALKGNMIHKNFPQPAVEILPNRPMFKKLES